MDSLFCMLPKADEELKTDILQGINYLTYKRLEFDEVFIRIVDHADFFLKIIDSNTDYN